MSESHEKSVQLVIAALEAELKAAYDHAATMEAESATLCKTLADADARIRDLTIFGDTVLATKNAEIERLTKLVEELKTIFTAYAFGCPMAAKPAPGGEGEK